MKPAFQNELIAQKPTMNVDRKRPKFDSTQIFWIAVITLFTGLFVLELSRIVTMTVR